MRITFKTHLTLDKLSIGKINQIGLVNSGQKLMAIAQENAPYETGKLKQGIGMEPNSVSTSTRRVRVGPRNIVYAVRREYENKKNPQKRLYMHKTADRGQNIVRKEFENAVKIVINSF